MAGVDPAQQRFQQPVAHLAAHPLRHQPSHGDVVGRVVAHRSAGQHPVQRRASDACWRQHTAARQRTQVGGHPEHGARQRPQPATRPHRRGTDRRVAYVVGQPDAAGQLDGFGAAVEQGLRPGVDLDPGELAQGELAAERRRLLEHGDPGARAEVREPVRRGEAADAPADHHDGGAHGFVGHRPMVPAARCMLSGAVTTG